MTDSDVCRRALGCEWGGKTHTALQGQSQARVGYAARSRQDSLEWVSEQRAHSIGLAAAAHMLNGGKTHTALQGQSQARVCA